MAILRWSLYGHRNEISAQFLYQKGHGFFQDAALLPQPLVLSTQVMQRLGLRLQMSFARKCVGSTDLRLFHVESKFYEELLHVFSTALLLRQRYTRILQILEGFEDYRARV